MRPTPEKNRLTAHLRAHITTQEAMEASVEASMAQLDEFNRRLMLRQPPR
nr:hypothetical protein [Xanthomonas arboricola]